MRTLDRLEEKLKHKPDVGKPCPICGASPVVRSRGFDPWGDMGYDCCTEFWLECSGCGIIKASSYDNVNVNDVEAKNKAIQDWNEVVDYVNNLIEQKNNKVIEHTCPKCGSHNIESNKDINNAFIRCKDCGHYLREGKR